MSINSLVLIGNLVESPEVAVTNGGTARTRFRVASTERRRDAATDTWQDGPSVFMQVTCWRRLAENVGNSLSKGDRVIVFGRLRQWVAEKDGVRRTLSEIEADAVGPDLQRGIVTVARPRRAPQGEVPSAREAAEEPRDGEAEQHQGVGAERAEEEGTAEDRGAQDGAAEDGWLPEPEPAGR